MLGGNVTASGNVGSSQLGFAQSNAAGAASQGAVASNEEDTKKTAASAGSDDDEKKKRDNGPVLARRVGRVTVILPKI